MISLNNIASTAAKHGKTELNRIAYLDGWRGLAICFVLVQHFTPISGIILGQLGVDVFFVLSGLLISKILFIKRIPLSTFYKRRISRILPVFIIFVSLLYASSFLFQLSAEHENYLFVITFLRSYFPATPDIWNTGIPIGHIWSLNVEEHCYILLSLIAILLMASGYEYVILLTLGFSSIILHYIYAQYPSISPINYQFRTEVNASFLLISAGYFLIKNKVEPYIKSWMPIATFSLAMFCYSALAPKGFSWAFPPILLAFTVNHLNQTPKFILTILSFKPLQLLGIWSYSIYLWQQPFYFYGVKNGEAFPFAGATLLIVVIIIGFLSFNYLENPIRKYLNEKW